jgi:hypothetical protein
VSNDWSKCRYVTDEGELLQGTAVLLDGPFKVHGRFLEPGVFLGREEGSNGFFKRFEGCYVEGRAQGLCQVVWQNPRQQVTAIHTGNFAGGYPNGFGVYRTSTLVYIGFFTNGYPSGYSCIRDISLSFHFFLQKCAINSDYIVSLPDSELPRQLIDYGYYFNQERPVQFPAFSSKGVAKT